MTLLLVLLVFGFCGAQVAQAQVTIKPVTWNVIGLDSNNVQSGPDTFPVGARVCNAGGAAINNVAVNFVWDSTNLYINLSDPAMLTSPAIPAGGCVDFYFNVTITRTSAAHGTARRYHITASANGFPVVSTPVPRELFVERFVSQNRNSIVSITGPTTVYVGETYTYTVRASTATGGYEQLEAFLNLSSIIFQVQSVATTYTAPANGTNDKIYADGCGWDNNPTSATYRSCIGPANYPGGKAGGNITTTYTVKVLNSGSTTATTMVHDFSGSSYHYNSDYGVKVISVTALPSVPNVTLDKSVSPNQNVPPGTDLTYTITFTNSGKASATNLMIVDAIPPNTDFKLGSATTDPGSIGMTLVIEYSSNYDPSNPSVAVWNYAPISGAGGAPAGYDRLVRAVRWRTSVGTLSQTAPNNTGGVRFIVRVR